ncbi:MAG: hypothetical protein A2172_04750 [Candidatus Woykebacteria bacterium RBG_13_40_15]|uniref:Uncharacterized protein n=1 Tax=Candidatus Woykebacteria bacterium RBG_13_40_15 TaxID=1802593 RepID=A0A1G1W7E2_9BACT|nr:MAG: hypothetical protein A2172_04750 [Candidatus Woykebacteria bacterium RBG_13_40_15]
MENPKELEKQADSLRNNGRGLAAIEKYTQAATLYEQQENKKEAAECWHMVGVSYKVENDINHAIETLEKAAKLHNTAGNQVGVGRVHRDIGIAYAYHKEHDKAIDWLEKSEKVLRDSGDYAELGITEAKIGKHYLEINDYNKAEQWLQKGLSTIRKEGHWFYEMTTLLHFGTFYLARKDFGAAATTIWAGIGLIYQAGAKKTQQRRLAQLYGLLAQSYLGLNNPKSGAKFFKKAMDLLTPMDSNVSAVVYEDINAPQFVKLIKKSSPEKHKKLTKEIKLNKLLP